MGHDRGKPHRHGRVRLRGARERTGRGGSLRRNDVPGRQRRLGGARNVISGNATGVLADGPASGTLYNNLVGTDSTGTFAVPNTEDGIRLANGAAAAIGHPTPGNGNVVSGNGGDGIHLEGAVFTEVYGNRIGTDESGEQAIGNAGVGVRVVDSDGTSVGQPFPGYVNVIAGNGRGIVVQDSPGTQLGNLVGVSATEQRALPNAGIGVDVVGDGVTLTGGTVANSGADGVRLRGSNNTVSGTTITRNGGTGVLVEAGTGNWITADIYGNAALGVDLFPLGPDRPDHGDLDGGPNLAQNAPMVTVQGTRRGMTHFSGVLVSAPNAAYDVFVFSNAECDESGYGEAQRSVYGQTVFTNARGVATFSGSVPRADLDRFLTASAVDASRNTSELSRCAEIRQP